MFPSKGNFGVKQKGTHVGSSCSNCGSANSNSHDDWAYNGFYIYMYCQTRPIEMKRFIFSDSGSVPILDLWVITTEPHAVTKLPISEGQHIIALNQRRPKPPFDADLFPPFLQSLSINFSFFFVRGWIFGVTPLMFSLLLFV